MEMGHRRSIRTHFEQIIERLFHIYILYELYIPPVLIEHFFPDKLRAHPDTSVKTLAKHYVLYSKPSVVLLRFQILNLIGSLSNSVSFRDLLRDALAETDSNKRLNFVILNDRLICMRIPLFLDTTSYLVSKHIVLANRSKNVRFAEEIWRDGSNFCRLNNSSGTYLPEDSLIGRVVQFFNYLALELVIHGVAHQFQNSTVKHRIAAKTREMTIDFHTIIFFFIN